MVGNERGFSVVDNFISVALAAFVVAAYRILVNPGLKTPDLGNARVTAHNPEGAPVARRVQRGFTLIEILVAIAVGGLIVPVVVSGIFAVTRGTVQINTDLVILQDIDGASAWIASDLSQALTSDVVDLDPPVDHMRVDWVDQTGWAVEGSESHFAEYTLSGTDLIRDFDGVTQIVARRIADIQFSRSDKFITVAITSTLRNTTESLTYFVTPRADGALQ